MMYSDPAQEHLEREVRNLTAMLEEARQRLAEHKRYHETPGPDQEAVDRERLAMVERQQAEQHRFLEQQRQQTEERYAAKERAGIVSPRDDDNSDATRRSGYVGEAS
jgi:hypothetical protein